MAYNSYKSKLYKLSFLIFLGMMLIFPTASLSGAKRGLLLWFNTVLPTLLPFIIISSLIVKLNIAGAICRFLHPFIGKVFHVSKNACYPIVIGFLSGIPLGAKTSSDLIKDKKISIPEGQFLAIMCNNASPMFILGYIALSELKLPNMKFILVLILYGSSIITACIYRKFYHFFTDTNYTSKIDTINPQIDSFMKSNVTSITKSQEKLISTQVHAQSKDITNTTKNYRIDFTMIDDAITNGFDVITKIGGYIILFSILAQVILSFEQINFFFRMLAVGICEITLGVDTIASSCLATNIKIVLILTITSFGGFSGIAQTKSVFADSGLSIKSYMKAKILNAIITLCLSLLYVTFVL